MVTKARTPIELLLRSLSARPQGTRCVLVLEPDHIVEWPHSITDTKGKVWDVVIYRGDDVVSRRAWEHVWRDKAAVCLVISRPLGDDALVDASSVADLVSRAEGEVIDLSVMGFFKCLFPKVNPPPGALLEYKVQFVANVEGMLNAYPRFKERWGEPDSWGRGHLLTILILAQFPALNLEDVWCDEIDPVRFAAHACWLLCHPLFEPADLRIMSDIIWESSRARTVAAPCYWLRIPPEELDLFRTELSAFLVLRDLVSPDSSPYLDALLKAKLNLQIVDPEVVSTLAAGIIADLKRNSRWKHIQDCAHEFLESGALCKVADLLAGSQTLEQIASASDTPPSVQSFILRQAILDHCERSVPWPSWIDKPKESAVVDRYNRNQPLTSSEALCAALMIAAGSLAKVERTLGVLVPQFANAEELLDWYVANGVHLLEFLVADGFAKLETANDPALQGAGFLFAMGYPNGLRYRVRAFLNQLDLQLARIVAVDPIKFMYGARSAIRIIPTVLRRGKLPPSKRIWILVMDGMRYDTWDAVVRPLLMQHFEVVGSHDRPYFSLLPSKTDIARRGLLAANLGKDWRDYYQRPTKDERILAARALGVSKQDIDEKVIFVGDAQTTEARNQKLGYDPKSARDFNVLIYPVSDDLGHYLNDTLATLNYQIRQQVQTQQGRRGIVDDLRWRVNEGDFVLITSDHGFQELFPHECVRISRLDAVKSDADEDDVAYRSLKFKPATTVKLGEHITVEWEDLASDGKKVRSTYTLPVGGTWYQREKGRPTRFAHGGLSLAEMTIPGVLLRRIVTKAARAELLDIPTEVVVEEDKSEVLEFEVVNTGNIDCTYELIVRTNLGERLFEQKHLLAAGKRDRVSCSVIGHYDVDPDRKVVEEATTSAIFLELSHTDVKGKMTRPAYGRETVRVTVRPKPTKIDTDALKVFDDL